MTHRSLSRHDASLGFSQRTCIEKDRRTGVAKSPAPSLSPFSSVKGYDHTKVLRLTMEEYMKELLNEEERQEKSVEAFPPQNGPGPHTDMESHRAHGYTGVRLASEKGKSAVTTIGPEDVPSSSPYKKSLLRGSRFSSQTTFSSKYPVFDRLGHELCVLYQMQDVDVANEIHRLHCTKQERPSDVRRSAALIVHGTDSAPDEDDNPILAHNRERFFPLGVPQSRSSITVSPPLAAVSCSLEKDRLPSVFSVFREPPRATECANSRETFRGGCSQDGLFPGTQGERQGEYVEDKEATTETIVLAMKRPRSASPLEATHPTSLHPRASVSSSRCCRSSVALSSGVPSPSPSPVEGLGRVRRVEPYSTATRRTLPNAIFTPLPTCKEISTERSTLARLASARHMVTSFSRNRGPYPCRIDLPDDWRSWLGRLLTGKREATPKQERGIPALPEGLPYAVVGAKMAMNFQATWMECETKEVMPYSASTSPRSILPTPTGLHTSSIPISSSPQNPPLHLVEATYPGCSVSSFVNGWPEGVHRGETASPSLSLAMATTTPSDDTAAASPWLGWTSLPCAFFSFPSSSFSPPFTHRWGLGARMSVCLSEGGTRYHLASVISEEGRLAHGLDVGDVWRAIPLPSSTIPFTSPSGGVRQEEDTPTVGASTWEAPQDSGQIPEEEEIPPPFILVYPWRCSSLCDAQGNTVPWIETIRFALGLSYCSPGMARCVQGFRCGVTPSSSTTIVPQEPRTGTACVPSKEEDTGGTQRTQLYHTMVKADGREKAVATPGTVSPPPMNGPSLSTPNALERETLALCSSSCVPFSSFPTPERAPQESDRMGCTVVWLPTPYHALPLRVLFLTGDAYRDVFRMVLQMASDLLSQRVVHGNLEGLEHLWIAVPLLSERGAQSSATPFLPHSSPSTSSTRDGKTAAQGAEVEERMDGEVETPPPPFLLPLHWERYVDFRMFSDRGVGREIPLMWETQDHAYGTTALSPAGKESAKDVLQTKVTPMVEEWEEAAYAGETTRAHHPLPSTTTAVPVHQRSDLYALLSEMLGMRGSRALASEVYYAARQLLSRTADPSVPLTELLLQIHQLLRHPSIWGSTSSPSACHRPPMREATLSTPSPLTSHPDSAHPGIPKEEDEWSAVRDAFYQAWKRWNGEEKKASPKEKKEE